MVMFRFASSLRTQFHFGAANTAGGTKSVGTITYHIPLTRIQIGNAQMQAKTIMRGKEVVLWCYDGPLVNAPT